VTRQHDDRGRDRPSQAGPVRQDHLDQQASLREDPRGAASHQARPETDAPERASAADIGAHAARAAGTARPDQQNDPSSEASLRAFKESRGARGGRRPLEVREKQSDVPTADEG
jgi:hypothetical protein